MLDFIGQAAGQNADTTKFVVNYLLGALILVLYAKDKFNTPTYDPEAMGPFAHLAPQFLTLDSRYRSGRFLYVALMLALYSAICIVGPTAFNIDAITAAGNPSQYGLSSETAQVWPVAAAAFLVATGAASDNSVLGRIELFIRQYSHKTAYIPSAVSDLAFGLRNLKIVEWLNPQTSAPAGAEGTRLTEIPQERRRELGALIGEPLLKTAETLPHEEGDLATWIRANILFATLARISTGRTAGPSVRLDSIASLKANLEIYESLKKVQKELHDAISPENPKALEEKSSEVRRFSKDVSLSISVLVSQAARNTADLTAQLEQLGLVGLTLRDRSDHFAYTLIAPVYLLAASFLCAALWLSYSLRFPVPSKEIAQGVVTVVSGCLAYIVLFRVLDYVRDTALERFDWREHLSAYVRATLVVGIISSVISAVLLVFLLYGTGLLEEAISTPLSLASAVIFQFLVAIVGAGFGMLYMRTAGRTPPRQFRWTDLFFYKWALPHGIAAALLVGGLIFFTYYQGLKESARGGYVDVSAKLAELRPNLLERTDPSQRGFWISQYSPDEVWTIRERLQRLEDLWSADQLYWIPESKLTSAAANLVKVCSILNTIKPAVATPPQALRSTDAPLAQDVKTPQTGIAAGAPVPTTRSEPAGNPAPSELSGEMRWQLFRHVETCGQIDFTAADGFVAYQMQEADNGIFSLAYSLGALYQHINRMIYLQRRLDVAIVFPSLVAFLLAFSFGVGCRYGRHWWLNNEPIDSPEQFARLRREISAHEERNKRPAADSDIDRLLATPVQSLSGVPPIEAFHYEDFHNKLLDQLRKDRIVWGMSAATRKALARRDKPQKRVQIPAAATGVVLQQGTNAAQPGLDEGASNLM